METGNWKDLHYVNSIYELNKRYGWSKFVIIVPSIAIREGVYNSLQLMQDNFASIYGKNLNSLSLMLQNQIK
jgi:type III restriction enzyme